MALTLEQRLDENKRLLREQLKDPRYPRAEIMEAHKAIEEEKAFGQDVARNAVAMKDANGNEVLYLLLKRNPLVKLFLNIKKKVFELEYTSGVIKK